MELFYDQSQQKYGTTADSNSLPLHMQSDIYLQSEKFLFLLASLILEHYAGPVCVIEIRFYSVITHV